MEIETKSIPPSRPAVLKSLEGDSPPRGATGGRGGGNRGGGGGGRGGGRHSHQSSNNNYYNGNHPHHSRGGGRGRGGGTGGRKSSPPPQQLQQQQHQEQSQSNTTTTTKNSGDGKGPAKDGHTATSTTTQNDSKPNETASFDKHSNNNNKYHNNDQHRRQAFNHSNSHNRDGEPDGAAESASPSSSPFHPPFRGGGGRGGGRHHRGGGRGGRGREGRGGGTGARGGRGEREQQHQQSFEDNASHTPTTDASAAAFHEDHTDTTFNKKEDSNINADVPASTATATAAPKEDEFHNKDADGKPATIRQQQSYRGGGRFRGGGGGRGGRKEDYDRRGRAATGMRTENDSNGHEERTENESRKEEAAATATTISSNITGSKNHERHPPRGGGAHGRGGASRGGRGQGPKKPQPKHSKERNDVDGESKKEKTAALLEREAPTTTVTIMDEPKANEISAVESETTEQSPSEAVANIADKSANTLNLPSRPSGGRGGGRNFTVPRGGGGGRVVRGGRGTGGRDGGRRHNDTTGGRGRGRGGRGRGRGPERTAETVASLSQSHPSSHEELVASENECNTHETYEEDTVNHGLQQKVHDEDVSFTTQPDSLQQQAIAINIPSNDEDHDDREDSQLVESQSHVSVDGDVGDHPLSTVDNAPVVSEDTNITAQYDTAIEHTSPSTTDASNCVIASLSSNNDETKQPTHVDNVKTSKKKMGANKGTITILSRQQLQEQQYQQAQLSAQAQTIQTGVQEGVNMADSSTPGATTATKKGKQKPKKNKDPKSDRKKAHSSEAMESEETVVEKEEKLPPFRTATEALQAIPAQEVSITASTQIKMRRSDSTASSSKAGSDNELQQKKIVPESKKSKKKAGSKQQQHSNGQQDEKAARKFNNEVRACVERSDPDTMRELLHDKKNHHFALDSFVLETVMKAYVMAAMFEDALYCLRHCTMPGTLSVLHTERILTCLPQNLRNSSAFTAADMINALCIATEFETPTSRTYFLRIVRGIALEFLEEALAARDRICSASCERLVRAGLCVVDARLKRGKKPSELVVQPGDQLGMFVAESADNRGIQAGDAVAILPYAGPYPMSAESLDRNMIEATVTNVNPMVLRLQDKANASLYAVLTEPLEGNVYRIDKLANRMGFNRQLAAAVSVASPLGESKTYDPRRPCPELIKAITAMDENIDLVMKQGSGKLARGSITSTATLCAQAIPWSVDDETDHRDQDSIRTESKLTLEKYNALSDLNASQQLAVEGATTNRLTLVQGPPGTGKTAVAIRILQHWARLAAAAVERGQSASPILATSDSNIAVDNLVEGCATIGLRVVRLGRPEAVRPELLRFCVDRPPSLYGNSANGGNTYSGSGLGNYKEKMKQQLKNAQVICCTCIGSGGDILDSMTFERVLVDEATQATEPAVLVPLIRGCRQLVLVGDHCQLPPTVLSTRAEEEGHGVPLFSRMVACGVPPFMLDTQYRMHPCIAMFPSDLFYGGLLKNGVSAPERRPLAGFPWPREEFPVAFVPVKGVEMDDGVSKFNEAEAAAACDAVMALLQGGQCNVSDIAVVTPYAAQARLIRRLTRKLIATGPPYIEVSSVDGFQGREKEAVVFSAVRSNDYNALGFTSDWRRVNVSFTRARRALIVIGNDQTLRRGDPDTWMPWLAWADAHGINMDRPGVPRGRYEPEQLRRVRGGTTAAEMLKDVLARQQAQLKKTEQQQLLAEKNTQGHIMGKDLDGTDADKEEGVKLGTVEEDLALFANTEGNWDDPDNINNGVLHYSISRGTLTSASSSNELQSDESNEGLDVWDI